MNSHSAKQQSMNAQRKNRNMEESSIANDLDYDELSNFSLNSIGITSRGTLSYPLPQKFRGHHLIKTGKNAKVYLYNNSDVRGISIDGKVIFYLTNEQYREKIVQRILSQSQGKVAEIYTSELDMICAPSEYNEALRRKKRIAPGVRYE